MAGKKMKRVVNVAALHARTGPSRKAKVHATKKRGYVITYVSEVKAEGIVWLKSAWGNYYAKKHTRDYVIGSAAASTGKVKSPAPGFGISTPWRKKPNNRTYWQARGYHTGADYACPAGTRVVAVRSGRIVRRYDRTLGNVALLYADNGDTYWYCHLSRYGASGNVKAGQIVGCAGATGTGANGPHLHFEKRKGHTTSWAGTDIDPRVW